MASDLKILSVGGSIIIPKTGFDLAFLKQFRSALLKHVKQGTKFILVIGGGATARYYQQAAKNLGIPTDDLDWIGIHTTVLNAHFVRVFLKDLAHGVVITDPRKKIGFKKPILIAAGWKPGQSTDAQAVLLAKTFGAREVINLSNTAFIYDKDPQKFKDAQKIERIDWATLRKNIVGNSWEPGKNIPFDPVASREAEKLGLTVSFVDGNNLKEVQKAIQGKPFQGTVVR